MRRANTTSVLCSPPPITPARVAKNAFWLKHDKVTCKTADNGQIEKRPSRILGLTYLAVMLMAGIWWFKIPSSRAWMNSGTKSLRSCWSLAEVQVPRTGLNPRSAKSDAKSFSSTSSIFSSFAGTFTMFVRFVKLKRAIVMFLSEEDDRLEIGNENFFFFLLPYLALTLVCR